MHGSLAQSKCVEKVMYKVMGTIKGLARTAREGRAREIVDVLKQRWDSEVVSYGLRRDLLVPFESPKANMPLRVRPLVKADVSRIFDANAPGISSESREELVTRRQMLEAGIQGCYVAVTEDDTPCYMQWLIGHEQNERVQEYFKGIYPRLGQDEALLEGAFTPEAYRGQRIMPAAMAQLAEKGTDIGARWVITFVTHTNIASLKGCKRSGFAPYLMRRERWRYFRRQLTFTPLPEGTPYPFDN